MKRVIFVFIILGFVFNLKNNLLAQDPQFSQYYAAPLYLNPALTGLNQMGRAGLNYRNQWPNINAGFESTSLYVDYNFEDYSSSVGLLFNTDQEGFAGLNSTSISLMYAYQLYLNYKWAFRPAVQVSYYWRNVDFSQLTFGDQFDSEGQIVNPTGEPFSDLRARFVDVSLGGIVYNKNAWIGYSMHHVLEPNQSLINEDAPLPRKISLHGGYKIPFSQLNSYSTDKRDRALTPSFNYRAQQDFDQLDLGVYLTYQPILFGVWYRGIPIKQLNGTPNNESLVFMLGLQKDKMTLGYSFDFTLSDLGIGSGGAHEISWSYAFYLGDPRKPPRDVQQLRCPVPYLF